MEKVRWGIIGAGRIARAFAADCGRVAQAELVAVAARDRDRAVGFAETYQIPDAYGDYQSLFEADNVDAVYIATPHSHHLEQAAAAMAAGKHVLCEKPMVLNPDQYREMTRLARQHDVYLMEMMWTYFLPAIRRALAWLEAGRIGKLVRVHADFGYPIEYDATRREYDRELGGGCLLEMGIYPVAFAWLATGRHPEAVLASGQLAGNGVEKDVSAIFEYEGGLSAFLATSFVAKLPNYAHLIGEKGWISIPDFWRAQSCYLYHLEQQVDAFHAPRDHYGFDYQIEAACVDIRHGRRANATVPWAAGLAWQQHLQQIREKYTARHAAQGEEF